MTHESSVLWTFMGHSLPQSHEGNEPKKEKVKVGVSGQRVALRRAQLVSRKPFRQQPRQVVQCV